MGSDIIPPETPVFINIGDSTAPDWVLLGKTSTKGQYLFGEAEHEK